jgi:prenyltransferase beta subunit
MITTAIIFILITPVVLAKTRQSYLVDFFFENQVDNERFGSSYQDTAYSLEIIDYYDIYQIGVETKVDISLFQENLETAIESMFTGGVIKLYDLHYLVKALDILGATMDASLESKISEYLNQTEQSEGGYSSDNSTSSADMTSTYFVYEIKTYLNEGLNFTSIKNWILSCNNSDGGYGGNSTLDSSQLTSFLAVYLIDQIGDLNDLENRTATLNYFKSFYVSDSDNYANYGGYRAGLLSESAVFSSTFYCVSAIKLLDSNQLNKAATLTWVLNHQNFEDGGFSNLIGGTVQGLSSIPASYYAFKLLMNFNSLGLLNEDIFMVEFNYIILLIVLGVIGSVIVLIYFVWRKRRI